MLDQQKQLPNEAQSGQAEMPMMQTPLPLAEVLVQFHAFNTSFKSVVLATVNADGDPDASYAPTLQAAGKYYVFVSELAAHTRNLLQSERASLLFIEPEADANLFRRQRSMIRVSVGRIGRETAEWSDLLDRYEQALGKMMRNLRGLADFHLFELTPIEATYVRGFGQAYKITGDQLGQIDHLRDRGHGQSTLTAK